MPLIPTASGTTGPPTATPETCGGRLDLVLVATPLNLTNSNCQARTTLHVKPVNLPHFCFLEYRGSAMAYSWLLLLLTHSGLALESCDDGLEDALLSMLQTTVTLDRTKRDLTLKDQVYNAPGKRASNRGTACRSRRSRRSAPAKQHQPGS